MACAQVPSIPIALAAPPGCCASPTPCTDCGAGLLSTVTASGYTFLPGFGDVSWMSGVWAQTAFYPGDPCRWEFDTGAGGTVVIYKYAGGFRINPIGGITCLTAGYVTGLSCDPVSHKLLGTVTGVNTDPLVCPQMSTPATLAFS
jgi:hypothetical protein